MLAKFDSLDAVFDWARRKAIPRVQPRFEKRGDQTLLFYPGDPMYPPVEGFDARGHAICAGESAVEARRCRRVATKGTKTIWPQPVFVFFVAAVIGSGRPVSYRAGSSAGRRRPSCRGTADRR